MADVLLKSFNLDAAISILEDIQNQRARYYYFLGGTESWGDPDLDPNSSFVETAKNERTLRSNIAAVKRITPGEVSLVVAATGWESGLVFEQWDDARDMSELSFFVVNDEYQVFKCLDNANNSVSTVKPSGVSIDPFRTSDGYLWKYLYTIPAAKRHRFVALGHIPVQRALSDSFYNNGSISSVVVKNGGSGYADAQLTTVQITGQTTGAGATAKVGSVDVTGKILSVDVTSKGADYIGADAKALGNGIDADLVPVLGTVDSISLAASGSGYQTSDTIVISQPDVEYGVQAQASIQVVGGAIASVNLLDGGSGYLTAPTVSIQTTTGNGASFTLTHSAGKIGSIKVNNGGFGYSVDDVVAITVGGAEVLPVISRDTGTILEAKVISKGAGYIGDPTLTVLSSTGFGVGVYGNSTAILLPVMYEGSLQSVMIKDPGKDYPADSDTTISVIGEGRDARFTPVVWQGKIIDVIIESPGFGYTTAQLYAQSDTGTGAILEAIISQSDMSSEQSYIEQTTAPGAIYNIKVETQGENYSSNTVVTVDGNGEGCTAEAVVRFGKVESITILTSGRDYTWATVTISDSTRINVNNEFEDATARAILPPAGGHGSNAPAELYARTIHLTAAIQSTDVAFMPSQDFRFYGIIKDPEDLYTGNLYTQSKETLMYEMSFSFVTGLEIDEILLLNKNRFRVASIIGTVVGLIALDKDNILPVGQLISAKDNLRSYTSEKLIGNYPRMNKYSGDLIFVTTEDPFSVTEEQSVVTRTLIKI